MCSSCLRTWEAVCGLAAVLVSDTTVCGLTAVSVSDTTVCGLAAVLVSDTVMLQSLCCTVCNKLINK